MIDDYKELHYCPECDQTCPYDDLLIIPFGAWEIYYACPLCGARQGTPVLSNAYYDLGFYLLSVADDEMVWPGVCIIIPPYEA